MAVSNKKKSLRSKKHINIKTRKMRGGGGATWQQIAAEAKSKRELQQAAERSLPPLGTVKFPISSSSSSNSTYTTKLMQMLRKEEQEQSKRAQTGREYPANYFGKTVSAPFIDPLLEHQNRFAREQERRISEAKKSASTGVDLLPFFKGSQGSPVPNKNPNASVKTQTQPYLPFKSSGAQASAPGKQQKLNKKSSKYSSA